MKTRELFSQLWRVLRGIVAEAQPDLKTAGLSPRAFFLLSKVEEFHYPAQLAEELLMPPPAISQIVRELEGLGYLERQVDQRDLRRYRLSVTLTGAKALERVRGAIAKVVEKRCSGLARADLKKLEEMLAILEAR